MEAPRHRQRPRWQQEQQDSFFEPVEASRGSFREYGPVIFGGIMLVAAFAFAGHQIGRNAAAHTSIEASVAAFELPAASSVISKDSLIKGGQSVTELNTTTLRRLTVMSDGKGDLLILDPGASEEIEALEPAATARKTDVASAGSEKSTRIKIEPAAFSAADAKAEDARKIAKKLALAPKPAQVDKSLKIKKQEKQLALRQRKLRAAEENCLARAVYFEARSESEMGQIAVAKVIMNRVRSPDYPKTICGVVYQGSHRRNSCQFSFACDGLPDDVKSAASWAQAKKVANKVMDGNYKMTDGMSRATNYHADYVRPKWAKSMKKIVKIGTHVFYDENG